MAQASCDLSSHSPRILSSAAAMDFKLAKKTGSSDCRPYVCEQCGMSAAEAPGWCMAHNPRQTRRNAVKGVRLIKMSPRTTDESPDDLD